MAAALQIYEAQKFGDAFGGFGMTNAVSRHPLQGVRKIRDELAVLLPDMIRKEGEEPSRWKSGDFTRTTDYSRGFPLTRIATPHDRELTVEFSFGAGTSLCSMVSSEPHPFYGEGMLITHYFPVSGKEDEKEKWIRRSLSLNEPYVSARPVGYGFGSFLFREGMLVHVSFFPNTTYAPGILNNFFLSSISRGDAMNELFARKTAKEDDRLAFSPFQGVFGRLEQWLKE